MQVLTDALFAGIGLFQVSCYCGDINGPLVLKSSFLINGSINRYLPLATCSHSMRFTHSISLVTLLFACASASQHIVVPTQYGNVLGYQTDLARVFYGIPFAKPPIGVSRWQPPTPVARWYPNVINATEPPPACTQPPNTVYGVHLRSQVSGMLCLADRERHVHYVDVWRLPLLECLHTTADEYFIEQVTAGDAFHPWWWLSSRFRIRLHVRGRASGQHHQCDRGLDSVSFG